MTKCPVTNYATNSVRPKLAPIVLKTQWVSHWVCITCNFGNFKCSVFFYMETSITNTLHPNVHAPDCCLKRVTMVVLLVHNLARLTLEYICTLFRIVHTCGPQVDRTSHILIVTTSPITKVILRLVMWNV